jgi:hypothetical protein
LNTFSQNKTLSIFTSKFNFMKNRKSILAFLFPVVVLLLGVSQLNCSKDGPAGPQGSAGPQGPAGPTGSAGPAGTANVIYSAWFLTGAAGWDTASADLSSYGAFAIYDKAAPGVTQGIIDNGIVLAYMKGDPSSGLANDVFPLPYTFGIGYGYIDHWDFDLNTVGNIRFLYKSTAPWMPTELGGISFRYVIVPGGVVSGRMRDPRKMTYDEVCQAYGIPK